MAKRIRTLPPMARPLYGGLTKPSREFKPRSVETNSAEHIRWRDVVMQRAGWRCQAIENGQRCSRRSPPDRLFADHVVELSDGGAPLDPANGQALCGSHHTAKTGAARARRMGSR
jgi:5-methylcytosine-specific restriction enzyme A